MHFQNNYLLQSGYTQILIISCRSIAVSSEMLLRERNGHGRCFRLLFITCVVCSIMIIEKKGVVVHVHLSHSGTIMNARHSPSATCRIKNESNQFAAVRSSLRDFFLRNLCKFTGEWGENTFSYSVVLVLEWVIHNACIFLTVSFTLFLRLFQAQK